MDIENSDTQSEIINPVENIDNNIENLEDDNDIDIEEFEDTDTQLYGKNFEPKVNILNGIIYCTVNSNFIFSRFHNNLINVEYHTVNY